MKPAVTLKTLIDLLSISNKTRYEKKLVKYLSKYLSSREYEFVIDSMNNIYVTKGKADSYPLLMAHTDSVHSECDMVIHETMELNSEGVLKPALKAYRKDTGEPCGIGSDDKAGIMVCLALLEKFDAVKVFFPVCEEIGCVGSKHAVKTNLDWFVDVDYVLMFDSPAMTMSRTLMNIELYQEDSVFFGLCKPLLVEHGVTDWCDHSYTDVMVIRKTLGINTLNLPGGMYNLHSDEEYVIIDEVDNAIELGEKIITKLKEVDYQRFQ